MNLVKLRVLFFKRLVIFILGFFILALSSVNSTAAEKTGRSEGAGLARAASVDSTAAVEQAGKDAVPVYVEFVGSDTIGSNLAFQLRERFNTSSQFKLTDKEEPKIRIILTTSPEFSTRPAVGSAYSVIWLYFERESTYSSYLVQELGTVSEDEVKDLIPKIVESTVGVAAKYGYLLK